MFVLQHPVTKQVVGVYVEEELGGGITPMLVEFNPDDCEHGLFVKSEKVIKSYMKIIHSFGDVVDGSYVGEYENTIHNLKEYVPFELNI